MQALIEIFKVPAADSNTIAEMLSQSRILRDYERAFSEATGLPLTFSPAGKKRPAMRGSTVANEFCVHLAETEPGCRMCVEMQEKITAPDPGHATRTASCLAGLSDSSVPVQVGDKVLGYLQTGQVALKKLTPADFRRVSAFLKKGGADIDWDTLETAYFGTRVIGRKQYDAVLRRQLAPH